jgi:hypothetical protein
LLKISLTRIEGWLAKYSEIRWALVPLPEARIAIFVMVNNFKDKNTKPEA